MTETFIKKGIFTISINLLILAAGWFTIPYIANEFIPSVEIPAVAIVVPAPMFPNDKIATTIAAPIESAFLHGGKVSSVEGKIDNGKAILIVFYKWDYTPEEALRLARQTVENIILPAGALDPIYILHRPSNSPIYRFSLYGKNIEFISNKARNLAMMIERIPGVAQVAISGEVPKTNTLTIHPAQVAATGINSTDIVKSAKKNWNFSTFIPSNSEKNQDLDYLISTNINSIEKVRNLPIVGRKKISKKVGEVGIISDKQTEPQVLINGDFPSVILEIIKGPGSDTIKIVKSIEQIIEKMKNNESFKSQIKTQVIYDEASKILEGQESVFENFYAGVVLNALILMIFLGSPIGVLVGSVVFPTSILGSLLAMKYFGISINLFSLNGFSLAVGMITDSATVILETISRRVQAGEEILKACIAGVNEVSLGIIASTLSSAGVLLPIAMQKNITSKLFSDLALTVVSSQLLSLIAVFSLVPWLCHKVLKKSDNTNSNKFLKQLFSVGPTIVEYSVKHALRALEFARKQPRRQLQFSLLATGISLGMLILMPKTEFLPMVSSRVYSLDYPLERKFLETDGQKTMKLLSTEVNKWSDSNWNVTRLTPNGIETLFELKNPKPVAELEKRLLNLPLILNRLHILPVGPAPSGEAMGYDGQLFLDSSLPISTLSQIRKNLCNNPKILECLGGEHTSITQLAMKPNNLLTHAIGSNEVESLGQLILPLNSLDLNSIGRLSLANPLNLIIDFESTLLNLPFHIKDRGVSLLANLYSTKANENQSVVHRLDQRSFENFYFKMKNATLGEIDTEISKLIKKMKLSSEAIIPRGGMATMNESFSSMILALILSGLIVFTILLIQFKSFIQASLIMTTIPLALGGAIAGLLIMGETMNASVMVGLILLVGIIVNNGIFLIESTNQKLAEGLPNAEAINRSVSERTRPILMTSFATIFGMLPTLLVGGEGSELYRGMAVVNVFGMLSGTFFSLIVTPMTIEYFLPKNAQKKLAGGD